MKINRSTVNALPGIFMETELETVQEEQEMGRRGKGRGLEERPHVRRRGQPRGDAGGPEREEQWEESRQSKLSPEHQGRGVCIHVKSKSYCIIVFKMEVNQLELSDSFTVMCWTDWRRTLHAGRQGAITGACEEIESGAGEVR